jgi:predicted alpha/beta hydrolase family esterase
MNTMVTAADTLILPGLNGSTDEHWQRHWARDRHDSHVVEQENWSCPNLGDWRRRVENAIDASPGGVWLVAHSLGCVLTASLAGHRAASRIRGALLVAPCDLETTETLHPCVVNFGSMPQRPLPFPSLVIGSLNDPYMSVEKLRQTARNWGSALIDIGAAGHINIASGFGRWKAGYDFFDLFKSSTDWRLGRNGDERIFSMATAASGLAMH